MSKKQRADRTMLVPTLCGHAQSYQTLATPWTVPRQFPLSMGFPSKSTGVGYHFLLRGIFLIQGSDPHLLHWQADSLPVSHQGCLVLVCWLLSRFSCVQLLVTPWTVALQAPLYMEFSRQEYWSWLPFPPPEDLLNPGIEPASPASPALQADSYHLATKGSLSLIHY